jgi:putative intracellular protease/amidase
VSPVRVVVRLLTSLAGLVVLAGGALLIVEVVGVWVRPGSGGVLVPWSAARAVLRGLTWRDAPVLAVAAGCAALGAVLLLIALLAGRRVIRLLDPAPEVTVTTDPRSLARVVGHRVRAEDGVAATAVTARRKRVRVKVTGRFRAVGDLRDRAATTASAAVEALPLRRGPRVSVSVSPAKER